MIFRIAGVPGLGRDVQRSFGDCPVLYGGPVGAGGMTALHSEAQAKVMVHVTCRSCLSQRR